MLTTDADVDARSRGSPCFCGRSDQCPNAEAIEGVEGIRCENAKTQVIQQKRLLGVVPTDAERHLGEVVRSE